MNPIRILIDKDSVLYDISTPWFDQHNKEYPNHKLNKEDCDLWDHSVQCQRNNCEANIYKYFNNPCTWLDGSVITGAKEVTKYWKNQGYELGIVTTVANPLAAQYSLEWIKKNFKHIPNVIMNVQRIKHWISGDILLDDGPHNLEHFEGIRILYDQPWNRQVDDYIRVYNWSEVKYIVDFAVMLLQSYPHQVVERHIITDQLRNK